MSKKTNYLPFVIAAALLLLALNVFQWYRYNNQSTVLVEKQSEHAELQKIQEELDQDYKSALSDLEEMRGSNSELNEMIDEQKAELKKQKDKINGLIWTKNELGKAKEEISVMNGQAAGYLNQIRGLKDSNEQLNVTNSKLIEEKEVLTQDVISTKQAVDQLDSVRVVLVSEKEDLLDEQKMLSNKVDIAEAIKVNSIIVEPYSYKNSGDLKGQKKAKKTEILRTCIGTETNVLNTGGQQEFYVRMVDPTGKTLAVEDLGSGTLTDKMSGQDVRYTVSGAVEYNNDDANFCIDWKPNFELLQGLYEVEVFHHGYLVGNGSFQLK